MIAKIFKSGNSLALRLPKELAPTEGEVSIEQVGDKWVVSKIKPKAWPKDFFAKIRITDENFVRPDQGELPPAPRFLE